jgi:hypothetical protein
MLTREPPLPVDPEALVALSALAARPGVQPDDPARADRVAAPVTAPEPGRLLSHGQLMTPLSALPAQLTTWAASLHLPDLGTFPAPVLDADARRRLTALAGSSVAAGLVCGLVVPTAAEAARAAVSPGPAGSDALLHATSTPFAGVAPPTSDVAPVVRTATVVDPSPPVAAPTPGPRPTASAPPAALERVLTASTSLFAAVATSPPPVPGPATSAPSPSVLAPAPSLAASLPGRTAPRTVAVVDADPPAPHPGRRAPAVVPAHPAWKVTRPLPHQSGTGRRIVYSERAAHLWIVGADGQVLRDYPVTGRVDRPHAGVYHVFSKSRTTSNPKEKLNFGLMVRFTRGRTGAPIGFHTIPRYYDGRPIQAVKDLGKPIGMGGCVRQSQADAEWLYSWSRVGDTVVVLR